MENHLPLTSYKLRQDKLKLTSTTITIVKAIGVLNSLRFSFESCYPLWKKLMRTLLQLL